MLVIVAKCIVKPEGVEKFKNITRELIAKSQQETGCVEYNLYQAKDENNVFSFIEKWQDENAFNAHTQTKHFVDLLPKIGELTITAPGITIYQPL